ncbi:MAG: hypothetical protein MMC33_008020 [Icmadophila ericetorum]|nr:hypothetical protein [Icmadophila ericetorum]
MSPLQLQLVALASTPVGSIPKNDETLAIPSIALKSWSIGIAIPIPDTMKWTLSHTFGHLLLIEHVTNDLDSHGHKYQYTIGEDDLLNWLLEFGYVEIAQPEIEREADRMWKLHAMIALRDDREEEVMDLKVELRETDAKYKKAETARFEGHRNLRKESQKAEQAVLAQKYAQDEVKLLKAQLEIYQDGHNNEVQELQRQLYLNTVGKANQLKSMEHDHCNHSTQRIGSMQIVQRYIAILVNTVRNLKNDVLLMRGKLRARMYQLEDTNSVDRINSDEILEHRRRQIEELKINNAALIADLDNLEGCAAAEKQEADTRVEALSASLEYSQESRKLLQSRVDRLTMVNETFIEKQLLGLVQNDLVQIISDEYEAKKDDNRLLAIAADSWDKKLQATLTENSIQCSRILRKS